MRIRPVIAIARYDLTDLRRQRRMWVGLLLIPFITVSFLLLLPRVLSERQHHSQERAVYRVAVESASPGAPAAIRALAAGLPASRFRLLTSSSARDDVIGSRADVGLTLTTSDVEAALRTGTEPVEGEVLVLAGRSRSRAALGALVSGLDRFGLEVTDARLAERRLPSATVRPFVVVPVDLSSTPRGQRLSLAALLPLLVLLPIAGALGVAAQRISGSRDQRVFEPLLVLPFTKTELLLGKALAAMAVGSISLVAVVVPLFAGRFVPLGDPEGSTSLPAGELAAVLGIAALLLVLLVLLGTTVGAASRTSAELGSVLQMATLPIFLCASFLQFRSGIATTPLLLVLPFLGPLVCLRDVAAGTLTLVHLGLAVAATAGWGLACVAFGVHLLQKEQSILRSTG